MHDFYIYFIFPFFENIARIDSFASRSDRVWFHYASLKGLFERLEVSRADTCMEIGVVTGLDEANYDKSKCQDHFDAYKECKKQEVTVMFNFLREHFK